MTLSRHRRICWRNKDTLAPCVVGVGVGERSLRSQRHHVVNTTRRPRPTYRTFSCVTDGRTEGRMGHHSSQLRRLAAVGIKVLIRQRRSFGWSSQIKWNLAGRRRPVPSRARSRAFVWACYACPATRWVVHARETRQRWWNIVAYIAVLPRVGCLLGVGCSTAINRQPMYKALSRSVVAETGSWDSVAMCELK